jgi:SAM-dependent methyltransferase
MKTGLTARQSLRPAYTERVRKIFDHYAEIYNRIAYGEDWQQENRKLARFFEDRVFSRCEREVHRVLDVGCGTGVPSLGLAEMGYEVVGFDLSTNMIRIAQGNSTHLPNAQFNVADWREIEPDSFEGTFDAVIFKGAGIDLNETETEAKSLLENIYRLMSHEGGLYLTLRNWEVALRRISKQPVEYVTPHPVVVDGNIYSVIYQYEWIGDDLFADMIFQWADTEGNSEAFAERMKTLKVTEDMLQSWVDDSDFKRYERLDRATEGMMGNEHLSYLIHK